MELEVNNIKTWENLKLTIDINDFKHILISGASGIGKTTLLDCIYFSICGGYLTNKWSLRHKRKEGYVRLHLQTHNLTITRTLNPKSLTVNDLVGDEAQEYLSNKLDGGLFKYIGYLRQKSTYSYFISMPPKERMIFVENVIFTDIDIDTTKTVIKESIDKAKSEYILLDMQMGKLESRNIEPRIKESDIHSTQKYIDYLKLKHATLLDDVKNIHVLEGRLQDLQITQYELSKELNELDLQCSKIEEFCKTFGSKSDMYEHRIKQYEESQAFYNRYQELYKKQISTKSNLESKLLNLDELNEQLVSQSAMMKLYQDYLNVEKKIKDLKYNSSIHASLIEQYNNAYIIYKNCPNCDVLLGANFNGIHLVKGNEKTFTADQLNDMKQVLTDLDTKKNQYTILKEILTEIEERLHFPIWTQDEYNKNLNIKREQEKYHQEYNELLQLKKISPISPRISEQEYKAMKSDFTLYTKYKTEQSFLQEQKDKTKGKLEKIELKIKEITTQLEHSTDILDQINNVTSDIEKNQQALVDLKETHEYQLVYYQYIEKKQLWEDYTKFQKYFNETRTNVIMYTLESINAIIKKYIDGFFENYNIQLSFFVNDKDCIDIHMEYDNANPADLSILSGGEYDRVVLAIVLAFADFYKLPILLLDEILSSLDLHTLQYVMTHIHKCWPDNQAIIYVGHQMISGNFDHLIELDT
jgi:DNA repair exonuclease SbcCD ATPase subunit